MDSGKWEDSRSRILLCSHAICVHPRPSAVLPPINRRWTTAGKGLHSPAMRDDAISLLRELTEAHGVPGSEDAVRAIFRRRLEGCGTISTDKLGSIACERSSP